MATYRKQTIKDTTREAVIKLTGIIDATQPFADPANTTIIVSGLSGALDTNNAVAPLANSVYRGFYNTQIKKINYVVAADTLYGVVTLNWRGANSNTIIASLQGAGTIDFEQMGGLINFNADGKTGNTGDIFVGANGVAAGGYTLIVHLKKDNNDFSAGQERDPALIKSVSV